MCTQKDRLRCYPEANKIAAGSTHPPNRWPHSQGMGYSKKPEHGTGYKYHDTVPISQPITQGPCPALTPKYPKAMGGLPCHMLSQGQ